MSEATLFPLPDPAPRPPETKFRERQPIWTGCKAKLIERYLFYFVQITKTGTYIDGFAGPQRATHQDFWSARLVIESRPRWFKNFFLFEIDEAKVQMLRDLCRSQPPPDRKKGEPKRKAEIYPGDFNQNIERMLRDYPVRDKEPAFCLLDQRTFECDWTSVQFVAKHKTTGNKVELFYFFPEGWINRALSALKIDREQRILKWWGRADWSELTKRHTIERAKFVCDRFREEFGYKHVHPFPIYLNKNCGRIMYYMIHASDHDEAPKLMSRAYGKALDIPETPEQLEFLRELPKESE